MPQLAKLASRAKAVAACMPFLHGTAALAIGECVKEEGLITGKLGLFGLGNKGGPMAVDLRECRERRPRG